MLFLCAQCASIVQPIVIGNRWKLQFREICPKNGKWQATEQWQRFCFYCMPYLSARSHFTFLKKILSLYRKSIDSASRKIMANEMHLDRVSSEGKIAGEREKRKSNMDRDYRDIRSFVYIFSMRMRSLFFVSRARAYEPSISEQQTISATKSKYNSIFWWFSADTFSPATDSVNGMPHLKQSTASYPDYVDCVDSIVKLFRWCRWMQSKRRFNSTTSDIRFRFENSIQREIPFIIIGTLKLKAIV